MPRKTKNSSEQITGPVPVLPEQPPVPAKGTVSANKFSKYAIPAALTLALVIAIILGIQVYRLSAERKALSKQTQSSQQSAPSLEDEAQSIISAVGKLVVLPADEQPTIATVTDLAKLQNQPFFANAEVGDKVLIYSNAKKAILYRPSTGQIVELAPLNGASSSSASTQAAPSAVKPATLTVEIRNGTNKTGAALALKKRLSGQTGISVIKTGNAKNTYSQTELVDLSGGKNPTLISELQQSTGAVVTQTLPGGETSSSADVLFIIGQN